MAMAKPSWRWVFSFDIDLVLQYGVGQDTGYHPRCDPVVLHPHTTVGTFQTNEEHLRTWQSPSILGPTPKETT
jgi:hypothetical protein